MRTRATSAFAVLLALIVRVPSVQAEDTPLAIRMWALQAGGLDTVCLINLSNPSASEPISDIHVTLLTSALVYSFKTVSLTPRQSMLVEANNVLPTACADPEALFKVRFKRAEIESELILSNAQTTHLSMSNSIIRNQIVTALLSILSVLLGAFAAHRLTVTRDRAKERTAHRNKTFERVESSIMGFLVSWDEAPVAATLQAQIQPLLRHIQHEPSLVELYYSTYQNLVSNTTSIEEKKAAARRLASELRSYIRNFDPALSR